MRHIHHVTVWKDNKATIKAKQNTWHISFLTFHHGAPQWKLVCLLCSWFFFLIRAIYSVYSPNMTNMQTLLVNTTMDTLDHVYSNVKYAYGAAPSEHIPLLLHLLCMWLGTSALVLTKLFPPLKSRSLLTRSPGWTVRYATWRSIPCISRDWEEPLQWPRDNTERSRRVSTLLPTWQGLQLITD